MECYTHCYTLFKYTLFKYTFFKCNCCFHVFLFADEHPADYTVFPVTGDAFFPFIKSIA